MSGIYASQLLTALSASARRWSSVRNGLRVGQWQAGRRWPGHPNALAAASLNKGRTAILIMLD
jgi:hypothetical protein